MNVLYVFFVLTRTFGTYNRTVGILTSSFRYLQVRLVLIYLYVQVNHQAGF